MTVSPFTPRRDDGRPYWQVIYDYITTLIDRGHLDVGGIITHEELSAQLGGKGHQQYVSKVAQQLRETRKRNLQSVRGVGYQLVAGMEQVQQANRTRLQVVRRANRAVSEASTVDHGLLSPAERAQATEVAKGLAILAAVTAYNHQKLIEHEEEIRRLKEHKVESGARHKASEESVAELKARLDKLEADRRAAATD